MRIKIIRIIIIGLFLIVVMDLFYVQVIRGSYYYHLSKNNRIRIVPLEGWRGKIKDRNGKILADNRNSYNVVVIPQDIKDIEKLFSYLSEVLDINQKRLVQRYRQNKAAPFAPVIIAQDIERSKAIILEENKYRFPSLLIQQSFKRIYPFNENSAHVLGYVGKINRAKIERFKEYGYSPMSIIGYSGIEEYYDSHLKGSSGGLQIEVNSKGRQVRLLSRREPQRGQDITLTVDSDIQQMSMDLLANRRGAIIVMDIDNGEILGLTSSPTYDPNIFISPKNRNTSSTYFSHKYSPYLNRAIRGVFPPGSVFKVVMAICGLDSKKITQYTPFICKGFYELAGMKFRCTHRHGSQNLIESLAHSCNVYYYHLGLILGADKIYNYARQLGLGSLTHIDLPYEGKGNISSRRERLLSRKRRWYTGDTLNFSIGQGDMLTTPLQLVRMMATVARDGIEVQPHLVKVIGNTAVDKYSFERKLKIDKNIFQTIKKGLRATVTDFSGTAHILDMKEIYVAGKTGTAQTSGDQENHSWFVGYAKSDKKNIAFCVLLEHGGSSQNACLLSRQLLLRMKSKNIL